MDKTVILKIKLIFTTHEFYLRYNQHDWRLVAKSGLEGTILMDGYYDYNGNAICYMQSNKIGIIFDDLSILIKKTLLKDKLNTMQVKLYQKELYKEKMKNFDRK